MHPRLRAYRVLSLCGACVVYLQVEAATAEADTATKVRIYMSRSCTCYAYAHVPARPRLNCLGDCHLYRLLLRLLRFVTQDAAPLLLVLQSAAESAADSFLLGVPRLR